MKNTKILKTNDDFTQYAPTFFDEASLATQLQLADITAFSVRSSVADSRDSPGNHPGNESNPDVLPSAGQTMVVYQGDYGQHQLAEDQDTLVLLDEPECPLIPGGLLQVYFSYEGWGWGSTFSPSPGYQLIGNARDNLIIGNRENNLLDGQSGVDTLAGGKGSDVYLVDNPNDVVVEYQSEGGADKVISSATTYQLTENVENLQLAGEDDISGHGNSLDNWILGNVGDNFIAGGEGNDYLRGGLGSDTLEGGEGKDVFLFSPADLAGDADVITDFVSGVDKIQISNSVGPWFLLDQAKPIPVWEQQFTSSDDIDATNTAGARFAYNISNGYLYYDGDGIGGKDAIHFATLDAGTSLVADDVSFLTVYIPPCGVGDFTPYDFLF